MDDVVEENARETGQGSWPDFSDARVPVACVSSAGESQRTTKMRLYAWAVLRLVWSLAALALAMLLLVALYKETPASTPVAATVVKSHFSSGDHQLQVTVDLISPLNGSRQTATIEPQVQNILRPGVRVPAVYYYLGSQVSVLYAGPGGDARAADYDYTAYRVILVVLIALAAIPVARGVIRWLQILAASRAPVKTWLHVEDVTVGRWTRHVRAREACGGMDLEWQVLRWQPGVSGKVAVGGYVKAGRWLVIELPGKRYIWPSSPAQPVIGTGMKLEPPAGLGAGAVVDAHHQLLAAYVQILSGVDQLPFMVRRQPGDQVQSKWWSWWFGAPRFVVRSFVMAHVRRRLRALGSGLTRASLLSDVGYYGTSRAELSAAADECSALAATLPRAIWRTVTVFLVTAALPTGLTVYTAFFQAAPVSMKLTVPHDPSLLIAVAIALTAPFTFNRPLWCKQVMFNPALARRSLSGVPGSLPATWDVYKLEREVFLRTGLKTPAEWETRSWVTALVLEAYILAIFMPILFASSAVTVIEMVIATLLLSTAVALLVRRSVNHAGGYLPGKKRRPSTPWLR